MRRLYLVTMVLLLILSGVQGVQAEQNQWKGYASFHATYINFSNSPLKDDGWVFTGYGSLGDGKYHLLEGAISQTYIDYKGRSDLNQTDFTVAYTNTNQILPNHSFRLGFHYVLSDDRFTDKGKIFFGKVTYFRPYDWNAGLELDYSLYDNQSPNLNVFQILPHVGVYLKGLTPKGNLYAESKFYYIHKDKNLDGLNKDNFFSFEQSLSWTLSPYDVKLSGWAGEQIFAVKNGGFVVYNLSDKYKGGISLEMGYTLINGVRIALNLDNEWLKHVGYSQTVRQSIFYLSIGTKF